MTSHCVCDVTCSIWGCVSVLYTCILCVRLARSYLLQGQSVMVVMAHGKRLLGRLCGNCWLHFQGQSLVQVDGEIGSTEKEELVRYTRRLEVVQGFSKG